MEESLQLLESTSCVLQGLSHFTDLHFLSLFVAICELESRALIMHQLPLSRLLISLTVTTGLLLLMVSTRSGSIL